MLQCLLLLCIRSQTANTPKHQFDRKVRLENNKFFFDYPKKMFEFSQAIDTSRISSNKRRIIDIQIKISVAL